MILADPSISQLNGFMGNVEQQATSVVTATNASCYEYDGGCFQTYGFEVGCVVFCANTSALINISDILSISQASYNEKFS